MSVDDDLVKLKEKGNDLFREGLYDDALAYYTDALQLTKGDTRDRINLYKNRAACHLKTNDYQAAVEDCTQALLLSPNDTKALFRRCQANEHLERFEEAYKDACEMFKLEPKNTIIQPYLQRLHSVVQDLAKQRDSLDSRVSQMFQLLFDSTADKQKRILAANNCIVLAKEKAAAHKMFNEAIYDMFARLFKNEKDEEIILASIRIISELSRNNIHRAKTLVEKYGPVTLLQMLNNASEQLVSAGQSCIQTLLNVFSGTDKNDKPDKAVLTANKSEINKIMKALVNTVNARAFSAIGRDGVLELIMKNVDYTCLDWGLDFIEADGVYRVMDVASELQEIKYESSMNITDSTRTIVAATLQRSYDALTCDMHRDMFRDKVDEFVKDKLRGPHIEAKVRVTAAVTVLLQGPMDLGNYCIAQQGVLEMMLVMAGTDDIVQQRVSAEAIIAAASKKDKCSSIMEMGMTILKKLYQSNNEGIRVRALVGLCKIGSMGGTDASIKPFADGSQLKLSNACRKFLVNPSKDKDLCKWAVEGLSYLTLDADVKEELVEDTQALLALVDLAKTGDQSCLFGVVTTLVNLTNSYDKQEIIPEMIELAKFAKQHIPVEHAKDDREFVKKRIKSITDIGITAGLVALSKTQAKNSRELIARVFNAICECPELRGSVVQHGGAKVLIAMSLDSTSKGKLIAAQALARIGITQNPEVSFPGQRCLEVVRPILQLLHFDCSALQNFEALMALCNLAVTSPSIRNRIVSEGGVSKIETYMYEDHVMLKRASTQCMVNMLLTDEVLQLQEAENDRVKYWTLLTVDDDHDTAVAAAKGLAILTGSSKKCCEKVFQPTDWLNILKVLLVNENVDLQHCGTYVVANMMASKRETAEKLIETDIMEVLMAVSQLEEPTREKAKKCAKEALDAAEKWKLIRPNVDDEDEVQ